MHPPDLSRIVLEDTERGTFQVDRCAYVDTQIAELEMQRIFDRC